MASHPSLGYRIRTMRPWLIAHPFGSRLAALIGALAIVSAAYCVLRPQAHPVAMVINRDIRHVDSWSDVSLPLPDSEQDVLVHVWSALPFGVLEVHVDDCLQRVSANGKAIVDKRLPYCNWYDRVTIDVSDGVHIGSNSLTLRVRNGKGAGSVRVGAAHASWLFRFYLGSVIALIAAFGVWWFIRAKTIAAKVTVSFVIAGILLRIVYAAYTEFDTRAYDWDGHLEYIRFIADHWMLPVGNQGWEFHQQPLYYLFGGGVLWVMRVLHAQDSFVPVMQFFSLIMSVGTLCIGAWIASMLFPEREKRSAFERFAFVGLVATLPNLVMFSSRVNNDVPTTLFVFLTIAFLVQWWKRASLESWAAVSGFAALALLTKSSALPVLVPIAIAFVLRKDSWKNRCINVSFLALLLGIVLGGTFVVRVLVQGQHELVPVWVTSGLRVKNFVGAYTTFNPWQVLMHPFNHNWIDDERRQYLCEYFFKSAFFGEWGFGSFFDTGATIVLSSALVLIPAWLWGVVRSLRKPFAIPFMFGAFMATSLLALATFRYMHPNSSNQELRYIAFVILPMAYFLARGIASMRYRWPFTIVAAVMFAGSSAFLLLAARYSL